MKTMKLLDNVKNEPIISFVVPTYKRKKYIFNTIDSIISQTNMPDYEIIICNNSVDDYMEDLIDKYKNFPIVICKNVINYGQIGNINLGIELSRGKYISIVHDDDFLLPNYYNKIKKYIGLYDCIVPSIVYMDNKYNKSFRNFILNIFFWFRYIYRGNGRKISEKNYVHSMRDIFNPPSCGVIFKKKSLVDFGYFKEIDGSAWDLSNYLLFSKKYNVFLCHKKIGVYRTYTGMTNTEKVQKDFLNFKTKIIEEFEKKYLFIRFFKKCILSPRKNIKYFLYLICRISYCYIFNLDSTYNLSNSLFVDYERNDLV